MRQFYLKSAIGPKKALCFFLALLSSALLLSGCFEAPTATPARADAELAVHFLDVGQADCALLLLPHGQAMLIDAGGNETGEEVVEYLREQNVEKLDYVVATHPHADHIGGMDKVADAFDIGTFYMPRIPEADLPTTRTFEDMLIALDQRGLALTQAKAGEVILDGEDLRIEVLSPLREEYDDLNHFSAIVLVTFGRTKFLFMGDAEKENEDDLLKSGRSLHADVIKIGHHGSKNASSDAFIRAVHPTWAVISCGKDNSYGHPQERVLSLLEREGITLCRTDEDGSFLIRSDGVNIHVSTKGGNTDGTDQ